ncbi:reverse transcriptase domain-containing protein [Tanacetum coccineum]
MHARASNSELVEPLPAPKRTLNRRLRRQNRRVPYDQRNNPPQHPRIVFPLILNINYFRHFLDTSRNYDPVDDEPMWAADRVVAPTPSSTITIPKIANEFAIKCNHLTIVKGNQFDGDSKTDPHKHIHEFLGICDIFQLLEDKVLLKLDWAKNQKTKSSLKKIVAFADEGSRIPTLTRLWPEWIPNTIKMDAQYKELQSHAKQPIPNLNDDDIPMSREEEAKFMQTFPENMLVEVGKFTFPADFVILEMEEDSKVYLILGRPFLHTTDVVIRVKHKQLNLGVKTERMILEEYFNALLDEGSKILHYIEGTVLEDVFSEFDKFIAMVSNENYDSESDEEEPKFEKITINTDYKIKTSLEEPLTDLKLKPLPDNLHKEAFAWKIIDIPGICPSFWKHKIQLLHDKKPVVQKQRRLNPNMQEVVKKEIMKLLDTSIIYLIADSPWVSPIHCVPKKGGITVVTNENDELVSTRTVTDWRVCIDYHKLNEATAKDHFPLPFMDQMRMPFGLCNAPATFQRCMLAIFHDMIEESVEVFMDDFSVFGNSFDKCLNNLDKMLQHCKDAHLVLNWEKCHFMVKEGIVLGHKVSCAGLEVDKAKINIISKLPPPTNIKGVRSFLGHAGFYRRFIKDFLKIARPITKLLENDTPFEFNEECRKASNY